MPEQSILVVDDTVANLRLLHQLLGGLGFHVRLAPSGAAALRSVREEAPDLILLDVVMPQMDGFEVCRRLKADPATRHIPVLFISALSDTEDKLKAFEAGAVDYVTKPFQSEEVVARVRTHLELEHHRRALAHVNGQLTRSNQELERFADVLAHDLKGPLQSIASVSELLVLTAGPELGEKHLGRLESVRGAAHRMALLVDSLRHYSRLSTEGLTLVRVELEEVAGRVREDLAAEIAEVEGTVDIGPLPPVMGDATQLWQLLENLVANGLKFHRPGVPPRVFVTAERLGERVRVSVRDEGVGFDESRKERVFQIFHRLHDEREFQGTGIGLAVCKKIVERHGGTIDVSTAPGQGATFSFDLPQA